MSESREITGDVFNITGRLKEIDPTYRVFFQPQKCVFELHGGREGGLIMTLPFDRLDARTVVHVRRTRIERIRQEMEEIDRYNRELEERAQREAKTVAAENLRESASRVYDERNRRKD